MYGQRSLIGRVAGTTGEGAEQGEKEGAAHIEILFNRAEAGRELYVRRRQPRVAEFSLCAAPSSVCHPGRAAWARQKLAKPAERRSMNTAAANADGWSASATTRRQGDLPDRSCGER